MKRETRRLLKTLDEVEWLSNVGQAAPGGSESVVVLSSWSQAVQCCSSRAWTNFTLEQRNLLTMYLHANAMSRYQKWNAIVVDIKKVLSPLMKKRLSPALKQVGPEKSQKAVRNAVAWDVLAACMELEFADVREPAFFCGLMPWYTSGRFPCGWGDRSKAGKMRLYGPVDESEYDPNEPDWLKLVLAQQERIFHPKVRLPSVGKLVVY